MNKTTMNGTETVADDNEAYWIALVTLLNMRISQYGLGLIWLVGNTGSAFTCIVFCQPTFRNSPCAIHFIASSLSQFATFNFTVLTRMLQYGYNVQAVNTFLWFCKFRYYVFYISVAIPRYNIILASIDCYFSSSRDALRRQWSSKKIAFRLIIGNAIFWSLIYVQVLIFYKIQNGQCSYQLGTYALFFSIYIAIDSGILPILLMLIFGLLTIRNVHQIRRRTRPVGGTNNVQPAQVSRMSNKDTQLYKMLASQICIFIILNLMNPCYLLYRSFTIDDVKSPLYLEVELLINNLTYILIDVGFALTFFTFTVSSKMFRREFRQVIQTKIFRRPVAPVINAVTTARTLREDNALH